LLEFKFFVQILKGKIETEKKNQQKRKKQYLGHDLLAARAADVLCGVSARPALSGAKDSPLEPARQARATAETYTPPSAVPILASRTEFKRGQFSRPGP
jgi:hypothetical protein